MVCGQVGGGSEGEFPEFLDASVAHIDEGCRLGGVHVDRMAVAVMIDGGQFAPSFVVLLGEGEFIDLGTVLEGCRPDFEGSRVEVLVDASAIIPVASHVSVDVERELLHAEVVALVVERSVEAFLAQLAEGVDGIADVSGGDGGFGYLEQSHVAQAGIGAPQGVDRVGVGGVGDGDSVFQYVDVGRGEPDLNFPGSVGAGRVEHDVTVTFFLAGAFGSLVLGRRGLVFLLCKSISAGQPHEEQGEGGAMFHTFFHGVSSC